MIKSILFHIDSKRTCKFNLFSLSDPNAYEKMTVSRTGTQWSELFSLFVIFATLYNVQIRIYLYSNVRK